MPEPDVLYLHARFWSREDTAERFLQTTRAYLLRLAVLDPRFQSVRCVTGSPDSDKVVRPGERSFEQEVRPLLLNKEKELYTNLLPNGAIGPETRSRWGFSLSFMVGTWNEDSTVVRLSGHGAIRPAYANVHVDFAPSCTQSVVDATSSVFWLTCEHWAPLGCFLTSSRFNQRLANDQPLGVGWLTYLADSAAADKLPRGTRSSPAGNGIVIQLAGETFSADAQQLAEARAITAALGGGGFLRMPPPTPTDEESNS